MTNEPNKTTDGHTATPWEYEYGCSVGIIKGAFETFADGCRRMTVCRVENNSMPETEIGANTRRIVSCVNGCAGIANPAAVGEAVAALQLCANTLRALGGHTDAERDKAVAQARAALAKLRGEAGK